MPLIAWQDSRPCGASAGERYSALERRVNSQGTSRLEFSASADHTARKWNRF